MASVRFELVTKRFGEMTAVNGLDFQVADGEFLVFVGPSGCGKTTSLRLLAGLEDLTSGHLYIGDRCVDRIPPKDRDIAMVFQSYALYPHMTVYENMAFGLKLRGVPKSDIEQRVNSVAKRLGLEALLKRKPKQLSGGQRQRVAVGRAIVRNPAVFLMDEPLSNLDAHLRSQARAEISKLHQQLGTTFVYVTHDQVEAMTMGSRIAVMSRGILQQLDPPQVLYDRPVNQFVAGFIGSPAMNFFSTRIFAQADTLVLESDSFRVELPSILHERFQPYVGQTLIVGIRPEHLHDGNYVPPGLITAALRPKVAVVELLGNETILHLKGLDPDSQEFVARVDPRSSARLGQSLTVLMDLERLHLFDPATGRRL